MNDHPIPKDVEESTRALKKGEVFRAGDWYGAGWGFKYVIGTKQTSIKPGDPVDGPAFNYNPRRPK